MANNTTTDTAGITPEIFINQMESSKKSFWETIREHGLKTQMANPDSRSSDPSYYVWVGDDRVYVGNPEYMVFKRFAYVDNE